MADEELIDALRLKAELGERVNRALAGLTTEEKLRWIREEAAKFWSKKPAAPPDEARKSA
jgi:hypothetical protein